MTAITSPLRGLTSTQKGKIWESLAASGLIIASEGRLVPFVPFADDDGIDAIVYDKLTKLSVPLQIKGRKSGDGPLGATAEFNVQLTTFCDTGGGYLLAMLVEGADIKKAWLIPNEELRACSANKNGKLVITPSLLENSQDRYVRYRKNNLGEVGNALIATLERRATSPRVA